MCVRTSSLKFEYGKKTSESCLLKYQVFAFNFKKLYIYLPQVKVKRLLFSDSQTYTQSFLFWKTFEIDKNSQVNRKATQEVLETNINFSIMLLQIHRIRFCQNLNKYVDTRKVSLLIYLELEEGSLLYRSFKLNYPSENLFIPL